METRVADALIVGGGFFGAVLALHLAKRGERVILLEREAKLLQRASFYNQARIHQGYHYPRAILTGLRSRANYPRFVADYADCVDTEVEAYYAVAATGSKVTADQFERFCRRIGAPLSAVSEEMRPLLDGGRFERLFRVEEAVFDAQRLAARLERDLRAAGVDLRCGAPVGRIRRQANAFVADLTDGTCGPAERVYLCVYAELNPLLRRCGLMPVRLKQEWTEMALIELPPEWRRRALTVMCGPFFSVLPWPAQPGLHTLSHVRYTPHGAWQEGTIEDRPAEPPAQPASRFPYMQRDAARFWPLLSRAAHRGSLWQMKTVLPASESDDSRPILFLRDHGWPGLTCILGGKIDNVYDMIQELEHAAAR